MGKMMSEWNHTLGDEVWKKKEEHGEANKQEGQQGKGGSNIDDLGDHEEEKVLKKTMEELSKDQEKTKADTKESWKCFRCLKRSQHEEEGLGLGQHVLDGLEETHRKLLDQSKEDDTLEARTHEDQRMDWILNFGIKFHCTHHRSLFENFIEMVGEEVAIGKENCQVHGLGEVTLELCGGSLVKLANVRYIPQLGRNYISIIDMAASGFQVMFTLDCFKACREDSSIVEWQLYKEDYVLHGHGYWKACEPDPRDGASSIKATIEHGRLVEAKECTMEDEDSSRDNTWINFCKRAEVVFSHWKEGFVQALGALESICDYQEDESEEETNQQPPTQALITLLAHVMVIYMCKCFCARNVKTYLALMMNNFVFDPGGEELLSSYMELKI